MFGRGNSEQKSSGLSRKRRMKLQAGKCIAFLQTMSAVQYNPKITLSNDDERTHLRDFQLRFAKAKLVLARTFDENCGRCWYDGAVVVAGPTRVVADVISSDVSQLQVTRARGCVRFYYLTRLQPFRGNKSMRIVWIKFVCIQIYLEDLGSIKLSPLESL